jgi:hypothetical protein
MTLPSFFMQTAETILCTIESGGGFGGHSVTLQEVEIPEFNFDEP